MLDLIDSVVGLGAIAICLVAVSSALPISFAKRIALAAVVGGWVGLAIDLGAKGALEFSPGAPAPLVGILAGGPLLIVGALALASRAFRAAIMAIPMSLLIGLNTMRVLGALFLLLTLEGRLGGPFPFFAGLGDIATGLLAIPLVLALARGGAVPRTAIASWNAFGILDLVTAIALGLTSANGSPVQLFHVGAGSQAMQQLPFCLVPTVLAPFYLIAHFIVAAQLTASRRQRIAMAAA